MALFRLNDKTIQKYYYRKFYPMKLEIVTTGVTNLTIQHFSSATITDLISLPSLNYNYELDFGDGTEPIMVNSYNHTGLTHTYTSSTGGTYKLVIYGLCEYLWIVNNNILTKVLDWGYSGLKGLSFHNSTNLSSLPDTDIHKGLSDIVTFSGTFMNSKISTIPPGIFKHSRKLVNYAFPNTFNGCPITEIPTDLFKYNINLERNNFIQTFYGTNISSIPPDIFKYNTKLWDKPYDYYWHINFNATFANCSFLTTIPEDLFRYNTRITFIQGPFYGTSIYSIPANLFKYNTELRYLSNIFYGMYYLTSVPSDLFRYNTKLISNYRTFANCPNLENVPDYLFKYNTNCVDFRESFINCTKLKINQWLFSDSGETGTRFLNKNVDFTKCFYRLSWTGSQIGYAQLIYYNYGTGTLTLSGCYGGTGNNSSSITNYNSIPSGWK